MREIKFRGISDCDVEETSVKENDMVFGQVVWEGETPFIVGPVVESCEEYIALESWCPVRPETLGQFTGLRDKHGIEIFEGDVIEFSLAFTGCITGVVEFIHNAFWIRMPDGSNFMPDTRRVVGNLHENPELIGEGNVSTRTKRIDSTVPTLSRNDVSI